MRRIPFLILLLAAAFTGWLLYSSSDAPQTEAPTEETTWSPTPPPASAVGSLEAETQDATEVERADLAEAGLPASSTSEEATIPVRFTTGKGQPGIADLQVHWLETSGHDRSNATEWADLILESGVPLRTDADGIIHFPALASGRRLGFACQDQGLFGFRYQLHRTPGEIQEIVLTPHVEIQVLVRFQDGTPAPGHQVSFAYHQEHHAGVLAEGTTDAEGRVTLHRFWWFEGERRRTHGVYLGMPDEHATHVLIPAGQEIPSLVELTVPEHGFVRIQAFQADGTPFPDGTEVRITAVDRPEDGSDGLAEFHRNQVSNYISADPRLGRSRGTLKAGTVRFPVALGQELQFGVVYPEHRDLLVRQGAGPVSPGQEVSLEVREQESRAFLTGRILDADGNPVARTRVQLYMSTSNGSSGNTFVTDDAGAYRYPVRKARHEPLPEGSRRVPFRRLRYTVEESPSVIHYGIQELALDLDPGTTELPDIVLDAPLLFAGTTVEETKAPVANVQLIVEAAEGIPGTHHKRSEQLGGIRTDAEGRFRMYGLRKEPTLQVRARKKGIPPKTFTLDNGRDGQVLDLSTADLQHLRVLLPDGCTPSDLRVRFQSLGPGGTKHAHTRNLRLQEGVMPIELAEGTYDVRLTLKGTGETLFEADGVDIGPGFPQDPRLDPIDLREALVEHVFLVFDTAGNLIPTFRAKTAGNAPDMVWSDPRTYSSGSIVFTGRSLERIFISAEGYSGVEVELTGGTQEVHLSTSTHIQLRFHGLPTLEEGEILQLAMSHLGTHKALQWSPREGQVLEAELPFRGTWGMVMFLARMESTQDGKPPFERYLLQGQEELRLEIPEVGDLPLQDIEVSPME